MLELAMRSALADLLPAVALDEPNHIADLHVREFLRDRKARTRRTEASIDRSTTTQLSPTGSREKAFEHEVDDNPRELERHHDRSQYNSEPERPVVPEQDNQQRDRSSKAARRWDALPKMAHCR